MPIRIVGFNLSHDSSACLLEDGQLTAALALERISRIKRGTVALHSYAAAMAQLTRELLASRELRQADVDYWIATSTESADDAEERGLLSTLGLLAPAEASLALPHPAHHLAHASAAFYTSGFGEAAAVVVDAYGSRVGRQREQESGFLFAGQAKPETVLRILRDQDRIAGRPAAGGLWLPEQLSGIGELYRVITLALGFTEPGTSYDDAGKTMGLAPYGRPLSAANLFIELGPAGPDYQLAADSLIELGLATRSADPDRPGLLLRERSGPLTRFHHDLAAQIQREFEDACLWLVADVLARTGQRNLVLSGGCFLNSVLNSRIVRELPVDRLHVFPAATDDGNAIGAALYAHHVLLGEQSPATALSGVHLGPPRVAGLDLPELARRWQLTARRHANVAEAAATAVAAGEIVGWFGDRSEFGPRALGGRSILCHPGLAGMKDRLNARVKFREAFRPFAASVLAEPAADWFEMPVPESPYMLFVCPVRPERRLAISEVVHIDGSCRVQTVTSELADLHRLLVAFRQLTGLPLILNTSFNLRGQPIVELPEQALDCLYGSRLDRLFIGDYEIVAPDRMLLRPVPTGSDPASADPVGLPARLLAAADGTLPVGELATRLGVDPQGLLDTALELRRRGLLAWAGLPTLAPLALPKPQYEPHGAVGR